MLRPPRPEDFEAAAPEEVDAELAHFGKIVRAYAAYQVKAFRRIQKAQDDYQSLPKRSQDLAPHFIDGLTARRRAVIANQAFLNRVIAPHEASMQLSANSARQVEQLLAVTPADADKVRSCLLTCMRDWSREGAAERRACYDPIVDALLRHLPPTDGGHSPSVLVPGAGAGRLAYEIAKHGYACQGNEFSYYMLILSDYLLNRVPGVECETIYPFAMQFSNVRSLSDALRPVHIPDEALELPPDADFSMTAGDFLEVYRDQEGQWDAVATCFFLDTAKDITAYIELIWRLLPPGGIWVNHGPLLYHYEEMPDEHSLELTLEDVFAVMRAVGFRLIEERTVDSTYTCNARSMTTYTYHCAFFVAIKPADAPPSPAASQ